MRPVLGLQHLTEELRKAESTSLTDNQDPFFFFCIAYQSRNLVY